MDPVTSIELPDVQDPSSAAAVVARPWEGKGLPGHPAGTIARWGLALALLVATGCSPTLPIGARMADPPAPHDALGLGPFDVVEVRVFERTPPPKLLLEVPVMVAADGSLSVPFAGSFNVVGKQLPELDAILTKLFAQNGMPPVWVSTLPREVSSRHLTCLGAFQHPGQFPIGLTARPTLVEVVAICGGLNANGDSDHVVLTRSTKGTVGRYVVSLADILRGKRDDLALQADDLVFVPERVF
jgi:protein involved in polysaccharide export with SLBB domain